MSDSRWGQHLAGPPRAVEDFAWVVDLASRRIIRMRLDRAPAREAQPATTCYELRATGGGRPPKHPVRKEEI